MTLNKKSISKKNTRTKLMMKDYFVVHSLLPHLVLNLITALDSMYK